MERNPCCEHPQLFRMTRTMLHQNRVTPLKRVTRPNRVTLLKRLTRPNHVTLLKRVTRPNRVTPVKHVTRPNRVTPVKHVTRPNRVTPVKHVTRPNSKTWKTMATTLTAMMHTAKTMTPTPALPATKSLQARASPCVENSAWRLLQVFPLSAQTGWTRRSYRQTEAGIRRRILTLTLTQTSTPISTRTWTASRTRIWRRIPQWRHLLLPGPAQTLCRVPHWRVSGPPSGLGPGRNIRSCACHRSPRGRRLRRRCRRRCCNGWGSGAAPSRPPPARLTGAGCCKDEQNVGKGVMLITGD